MKACSSISTDGLGAVGSSSQARCTRIMSSSLSASRRRSVRSGSSLTAGSPAGSIVAMSRPEPLTHSTACVSPAISVISVLSEVLPPPCSTSAGSLPSSRVV